MRWPADCNCATKWDPCTHCRGRTHNVRSQGFTLIEMAIVLAIISVLAAVLTPVVTGYVDQARVTRAAADVRTIADGTRLYRRDAGRFPIYANATGAAADTAAATELVGPGA